jgi:hypothetical protein
MQKLGYGPDKPLALTVSTRNLAPYRDPAVILIDQLKEIYVDGVLDPLDTTQWHPKLTRKDYAVGLNITETAVDDPDPAFYENYVCGAMRNYTGYCNAEVDKMVDAQSEESDVEKQAYGVGDREEIGQRRRASDLVLQPSRQLLASPSQRADLDGQQHLRRKPFRRSLARQIAFAPPAERCSGSPGLKGDIASPGVVRQRERKWGWRA